MGKIKAYSYLRISTETQKAGDGMRRQMEASQKYSQEQGYELVETISDFGVSAYRGVNSKAGAFAQFLQAIDDGQVTPGSVLIVESLDRLSRDGATKAFGQFAGILSKGIAIVTLMDGQVYTEESVNNNPGQLFMSLGIMIRANDESVTKAKRLKLTWEKKRKDIGEKKLTRMAPSWLILSDDRSEFEVVEEAARLVRTIYGLCIDGMGIYSITRHLNSNLDAYPPISRAKNWNDSYVAKILRNPAVHGFFQPKKTVDGKDVEAHEPIEDYFPPIISRERFLLAQSCMKSRRATGAGRKGQNFSNLFSNLIKCGACGGTIVMRSKGKPPKGDKYLRCSNSVMNNGCNCPGWRYSEFEDSFYKFIQEINFADLLNESDAETKIFNLENQKAVLVEKHLEKTAQHDMLFERLSSEVLSENMLARLGEKTEFLFGEIEDLKISIDEVELEISKESALNFEQDRSVFLEEYLRLRDGVESAESRLLRFRLHNLIKRSIRRIKVYNFTYVEPWEVMDEISDGLLQLVAEKGVKSQQEIEEFFSGDYGKRLLNQSDRHFVVCFNNGTERLVKPFSDHSMVTVDERFAGLRARAKSSLVK